MLIFKENTPEATLFHQIDELMRLDHVYSRMVQLDLYSNSDPYSLNNLQWAQANKEENPAIAALIFYINLWVCTENVCNPRLVWTVDTEFLKILEKWIPYWEQAQKNNTLICTSSDEKHQISITLPKLSKSVLQFLYNNTSMNFFENNNNALSLTYAATSALSLCEAPEEIIEFWSFALTKPKVAFQNLDQLLSVFENKCLVFCGVKALFRIDNNDLNPSVKKLSIVVLQNELDLAPLRHFLLKKIITLILPQYDRSSLSIIQQTNNLFEMLVVLYAVKHTYQKIFNDLISINEKELAQILVVEKGYKYDFKNNSYKLLDGKNNKLNIEMRIAAAGDINNQDYDEAIDTLTDIFTAGEDKATGNRFLHLPTAFRMTKKMESEDYKKRINRAEWISLVARGNLTIFGFCYIMSLDKESVSKKPVLRSFLSQIADHEWQKIYIMLCDYLLEKQADIFPVVLYEQSNVARKNQMINHAIAYLHKNASSENPIFTKPDLKELVAQYQHTESSEVKPQELVERLYPTPMIEPSQEIREEPKEKKEEDFEEREQYYGNEGDVELIETKSITVQKKPIFASSIHQTASEYCSSFKNKIKMGNSDSVECAEKITAVPAPSFIETIEHIVRFRIQSYKKDDFKRTLYDHFLPELKKLKEMELSEEEKALIASAISGALGTLATSFPSSLDAKKLNPASTKSLGEDIVLFMTLFGLPNNYITSFHNFLATINTSGKLLITSNDATNSNNNVNATTEKSASYVINYTL